MGRQRLPARCRGIHHSRRRGGGEVRRPIFLDRRHRGVCSRLIADRRRPGRDRGHRRACLAGAWRSLRRSGHPCGGVGGGPGSKRAQAISAWTGFLMLGFSIGPLVGGVMTHYAGWRSNFWLNVVVLVPAALMLWRRPKTGGGEGRAGVVGTGE